MAYSSTSYTGNGNTVYFPVSFPFLDKSHVEVLVNNVVQTLGTQYTWSNASTILLATAPAVGVPVKIQRKSSRATKLVDFVDATVLTEDVMDKSATQLFYLAQEALDVTEPVLSADISAAAAASSASQASTSAAQAASSAAVVGNVRVRNYVINGNFSINQRNVSGTVVLGVGAYGHDGWRGGAGGCTYTFTTAGNITTLNITAGSLQHVVEGSDLETGTYTLSWAGTAQGKISSGAYSTSGVTGSAVGGADLLLEFSVGTLSKIQLEVGTAPTPFSFEAIGETLTKCLRRCWVIPGNTELGASLNYSSTQTLFAVLFPMPLRAIPTMSGAGFSVRNSTGTALASTGVSLSAANKVGATIAISVASGLTAGNAGSVLTTQDVVFSADL